MQKPAKTVTKPQPTSSDLMQNTHTVQPNDKKCKSLHLQNRLYFQKNGQSYVFPIFKDVDIGIDSVNGAYVIELKVDEDCESSHSIVDYGVRLCKEDLRDGLYDRNKNDN